LPAAQPCGAQPELMADRRSHPRHRFARDRAAAVAESSIERMI
jgi:hypothetical protein